MLGGGIDGEFILEGECVFLLDKRGRYGYETEAPAFEDDDGGLAGDAWPGVFWGAVAFAVEAAFVKGGDGEVFVAVCCAPVF